MYVNLLHDLGLHPDDAHVLHLADPVIEEAWTDTDPTSGTPGEGHGTPGEGHQPNTGLGLDHLAMSSWSTLYIPNCRKVLIG